MEIKCKLNLKFSDPTTARKIMEALDIDNSDYIESELEGDSIISEIKSKSFMSLLHTIEDYLSCLSTAENLLDEKETNGNQN